MAISARSHRRAAAIRQMRLALSAYYRVMAIRLTILCLLFALTGCHSAPRNESTAGLDRTADARMLLQGQFDNREQVVQAQAAATTENPAPPHVVVTIEPTSQVDWSLWRVRMDVDAQTSLDATWAMRTQTETDASTALIPYYLLKPATAPVAQTFDPQAWLSLEACALRGEFTRSRIQLGADGMPCVVVATGIGPRRALLPVAIEREGEWLHVHLYYRGTDLRVDARRAQ
jgi:hypothetical protein